MKKSFLAIGLSISIFCGSLACADGSKPKYGPSGKPLAVPLSQSNEYFRKPSNLATAFWALIPFYIPQMTGASCSSASLTMTLNAARAHLVKSADDAVITEKAVMDKANVDHWKDRLTGGYKGSYGADLDLLAKVAHTAFKSYGFEKVKETVVHIDKISPTTKSDLIDTLKNLSDHRFIIANFNQKNFTADADVGHFAPVGAYDPDKNRVLVLDPDREFYEPYWISLDTFLEGMNTQDSSKKSSRGYIVIETGTRS